MGRGRGRERDAECGFPLRAQAHDPETRAEVKSQILNRLNHPGALSALDYVVNPPNQPISVPIIFCQVSIDAWLCFGAFYWFIFLSV